MPPNIFFRIGKFWEDHRSIRKVEFEERVRLIEASIEAQQKVSKTLMNRMAEEQSLRQQIKALSEKVNSR